MDVPKIVSPSSAVVILMRNTYLYQIFETYILNFSILDVIVKKSKDVPVTGRGGPYGCETSRFPHFLDNRLTGGGEAVSLTRRPLPPRKIPGTHFC
jgi:hypothetical protein